MFPRHFIGIKFLGLLLCDRPRQDNPTTSFSVPSDVGEISEAGVFEAARLAMAFLCHVDDGTMRCDDTATLAVGGPLRLGVFSKLSWILHLRVSFEGENWR